jgi:hypothetical protein
VEAEMSIEAMKQALEALETPLHAQPWGLKQNAIVALRTAIEQTEKQTPVAYRWKGELFTPNEIEMLDVTDAVPLYQNPEPVECMCGICKLGKWEWVGLANEEIEAVMQGSVEGERMLPYQFARAIEAKLKELNT